MSDFAERLYDTLWDQIGGRGQTMVYLARRWFEELLKPLGYERCHQDAVSRGLKELAAAGLVSCETIKVTSGYQARRRNFYTAKPRKVVITILR